MAGNIKATIGTGNTDIKATVQRGNQIIPSTVNVLPSSSLSGQTLTRTTLNSPTINNGSFGSFNNTPTLPGISLTSNTPALRTEIGLGNVTNESKATMFSNPTFTNTIKFDTIQASDGSNYRYIRGAVPLNNPGAGAIAIAIPPADQPLILYHQGTIVLRTHSDGIKVDGLFGEGQGTLIAKTLDISGDVAASGTITSTSSTKRPVQSDESDDSPIRNIRKVTQAQYDALTPDANTLYVII